MLQFHCKAKAACAQLSYAPPYRLQQERQTTTTPRCFCNASLKTCVEKEYSLCRETNSTISFPKLQVMQSQDGLFVEGNTKYATPIP